MKLQNCDLNFLEEFKEVEIDNKITPLICAASLGRLECTKLLLDNKTIDVNMPSDEYQCTPLGVACAAGNLEIVRLLLERNADVNKRANFEQLPLTLCFTRFHEEVNAYENQLICMKMAEMLLQRGADIDVVVDEDKGHTLLMQYCATKIQLSETQRRANKKLVQFFLVHGANPERKSKKGKTAFELAEKHCNKTEIQELLRTEKQSYFYESRYFQPSLPFTDEKSSEPSLWNFFCGKFRWCS